MTNIIGTVGILKLSIILSISSSSTRVMLVFPKPPRQTSYILERIIQLLNVFIFTFLRDETILWKGNDGLPKDIFYLGFFNIYNE